VRDGHFQAQMHIPTVTDTMEHMHRHNHIATVLLELFDQSNLAQFKSGKSVYEFRPHPLPIPVLKAIRPVPRTCVNISVHQNECREAPRPTRKRDVVPRRPNRSLSFGLEFIGISTSARLVAQRRAKAGVDQLITFYEGETASVLRSL
jgi:hypothetical protein